jgi:hypothetical protein
MVMSSRPILALGFLVFATAGTVASPRPQGTYIVEPPSLVAADPTVPNILYLNNCKPDGCVVTPGAHDSRTNRSSLVPAQRLLAPLSHRDEVWNAVVSCVRASYAPYAIKVDRRSGHRAALRGDGRWITYESAPPERHRRRGPVHLRRDPERHLVHVR